jgi:hypothetical protein
MLLQQVWQVLHAQLEVRSMLSLSLSATPERQLIAAKAS